MAKRKSPRKKSPARGSKVASKADQSSPSHIDDTTEREEVLLSKDEPEKESSNAMDDVVVKIESKAEDSEEKEVIDLGLIGEKDEEPESKEDKDDEANDDSDDHADEADANDADKIEEDIDEADADDADKIEENDGSENINKTIFTKDSDVTAKQSNKTAGKRKLVALRGNELTKLVPGYRAPMALTSSSLERIRPHGGLKGLSQRAALEDAQKGVQQAKLMAQSTVAQSSFGGISAAYRATHAAMTVPKKARRKANAAQAATNAGEGWFNMRPFAMTDELKHDMQLIKNRNFLDPKKFYKSADLGNKKGMVQVGTVIEGSSEFYSSRLTKKQRKSTLTDEIMADPSVASYAQNKYKKMQQEQKEKSKKWKKRNPNAKVTDFRKVKNKK